ncbi:MAG TPA: hypothetical protein VM619_02125 [Luteimonas sp.]|nr:hypothetical protein [Luteimonas sp.]
MARRRALPLALALAGCVLLAPALHAQAPMDFEAAKAAADADEASQDTAARAAAMDRQRAFLDEAVAACADVRSTAELRDFVVVVQLDAEGRVARTWRRGDSPLALCIERHARGKVMFVPPRAPFHASLEVGFVPG